MIYTVEDRDGLYDALAKATGGDTIRLQAGDYGNLDLNHQTGFDFSYDSPVTIVSANSENPASFSSMDVTGASNITFDNIDFDYTFTAGDALWAKPFSISDSTNITIENSMFDGDVASGTGAVSDGYGTGFGLAVWSSSGVTIDNTEFKSWWKGATFFETSNLAFTNNNIHDIRSDGINLSETQSVLIEGNYIHDFRVAAESGDHADMIQVISTGDTDTVLSDLTIRGNILDIGEGDVTQMIFMANGKYDAAQDEAWLYQDITIEDNLIRGAHSHGISVGATDGVIIRNNTMLGVDHVDAVGAPIIRTNQSLNVLIEDNAVPGIAEIDNPDATWVIQNNIILQNESSKLAGYYGDQFLSSSMSGFSGDYVLDPDGALATSGAGVTWMGLDTIPDTLTPLFDIRFGGSDSQTLVFDASHTYSPTGVAGAEFQWTFGDGTTASGRIVEHSFPSAGIFDVVLQVVLPDGTTVATGTEARIIGSDALSFNSADGMFYMHAYGEETALAGSDTASVSGGGGVKAVDLNLSANLAEILPQNFSNVLGSKSFDVSMSFQADQPGVSQGWLLHLHSVLTVRVDDGGDIQADVWDDAGSKFTLVSTNQNLSDGDIHSFEIRLDDESDTLQLMIDGVVSDSTSFTGELSQGIGHSLKFGSPWGGAYDGKMHAFDLDVVASDYSVYGENISGGGTSTPAPEDETSLPVLDDYVVDFAALTKKELKGDAAVVSSDEGSLVQLDGERDVVNLGKLEQFETARQLSVSAEFRKANADDAGMKLVWNNKNVGLIVEDDGLRVYVAEKGTAFGATGVLIDDLGLDDTDSHQAMVVVDSDTDRLQVILDGAVVYEEQQERNIELTGLGDDKEYNWLIGTQKNEFAGEVYEFMVDADADFVATNVDDSGLI